MWTLIGEYFYELSPGQEHSIRALYETVGGNLAVFNSLAMARFGVDLEASRRAAFEAQDNH